MTNTNNTQDVIARLLTNIGSRKEVEQYLRNYASVDAPKFAVVKASGAIIQDNLDALASSLSFLQRVGLVPIVVHVLHARLGGDREPGWNRQRQIRHLGQVRALAAEQTLHALAALGEVVHILRFARRFAVGHRRLRSGFAGQCAEPRLP